MKKTLGQASRYFVGAVIALAVDVAIVSALLAIGLPRVLARSVALLAGITTTYIFSRRYIFVSEKPISLVEWGRYVVAQSMGTALNFVASTSLLYIGNGSMLHVGGAIFTGAGLGFCYNFFAARRQLDRP